MYRQARLSSTAMISTFRQQLMGWWTSRRLEICICGAGMLCLVSLIATLAQAWPITRVIPAYTPADVVYSNPLVAVISPTVLQSKPVAGLSDIHSQPQLQVSELFYDFGSISPDQVATHTFVVANQGTDTLLIQQASTTCGCATAELTSSHIPPGKVALLTVHLNAHNPDLRGTTVRRGILLETNDAGHPTQEIWVQAAIRR